jgi:hypothetical protein
MMDEINRADNKHWDDEAPASAEFTSFDRLASMLISVPGHQIRAKLDDAKKSKETTTTPAGETANGSEESNHKDLD